MGSCLSTQCCEYRSVNRDGIWPFGRNRSQCDLHGSTFTHYSLTSETSILDLYPTLGYEEQRNTACHVCDIDWGAADASYRSS